MGHQDSCTHILAQSPQAISDPLKFLQILLRNLPESMIKFLKMKHLSTTLRRVCSDRNTALLLLSVIAVVKASEDSDYIDGILVKDEVDFMNMKIHGTDVFPFTYMSPFGDPGAESLESSTIMGIAPSNSTRSSMES